MALAPWVSADRSGCLGQWLAPWRQDPFLLICVPCPLPTTSEHQDSAEPKADAQECLLRWRQGEFANNLQEGCVEESVM